ncbi:MAG: serine/threonine-protein kinase [Verrucomicrobiota bacterium]|nr:serine/threonine-protein kinase [Verrucomicrobiota bacterium]
MPLRSERWERVAELFDAAVTLAKPERTKFLEQECADDPELRAEIESLLAADEEDSEFMEDSPLEVPRELFAEMTTELSGEKFGAYRIIREIGRGGLGTVYLGQRADEAFEKEVAIKAVRRGLDTEDILRRFRAERQILAQLDHPNIARLIDAGSTEEGRPYFVMEYVEGKPICSYCETRKLSTAERLQLFCLVCSAVTYAHQRLVIHRDIKPSNILVTGEGVPKLLDFGIAKLLSADVEMFTQTAAGLRAMTPEYASPEQVGGLPITTSTDIYSLGVLLYELLTGQKPYRLTTHTQEELSRAVTDEIPERPSTALRGASFQVAKSRDLESRATSLRGDLDTIVLMALRKEPARRYSSVAQFSEDIRRHLDGRPVMARKDTFQYRAAKFVRRNKVGVAAAALVVLSLITGMALTLTQARIAREQRDAAQRASARAEKTSRFLQGFLSSANPNWYGRGKGRTDVTVREAIDDAARRIDTELANEPEVRGDLHHTIGEIYRVAGEYEVALEHFRRSLDSYREAHGEQYPKVAMGLYYLAVGMGGTDTGIEEVEPVLRQGIAMMRQTDPENVNLPYMLHSLAGWISEGEKRSRNEDRLAEAERLIFEARPLFVRYYGEDHSATRTVEKNLALLALARGDLARAERMREGFVRRAKEAGDDHSWDLFYLAEVKLALGKEAEAEALFEQALELGRRQWGANDPRLERLARKIEQARAEANP